MLAQGLSPPKLLGGGLEFNVGLNEELLMTTASLNGLLLDVGLAKPTGLGRD